MLIVKKVPECDFTDRKYDHPVDGAAVIARGATGRWCEVMWMGPEFLAEANQQPIAAQDAREYIEQNHPGDWCDF